MVQVYADGFERARAAREDARLPPLPGGARRPRHLLRPALRAQPRDARGARGDPHARGPSSTRTRSRASHHYAKLFWLNSGPAQQPHRAQVRPALRARTRSPRPSRAAERRRRTVSREAGRVARRAAGAARAVLLRSRRRCHRHQQDAGRRPRHPGVEREQPLRRRQLADLDGFEERYPLNSRLVKRDGPLVEEVYRVGGRYGEQIAAIVGHLEAAMPLRAAGDRRRAARARPVLPDRRGRDRRGVRHRAGCGTATRRSTRSTGSSRSTSTRAGVKGAWESIVFYVNHGEDRGHPIARAPRAVVRRPTCRGTRGTGSRA